jgi:hypothetical protein
MKLTEVYRILQKINKGEEVKEYDMLRIKKKEDATKEASH